MTDPTRGSSEAREIGCQKILGKTNLRPQDRFKNPNSYLINEALKVFYCSFKVSAPRKPGVYKIFVNDELVYVGRAANLHNRLSVQYGNVSPRHPFAGGQLQKCRTNSKINDALCSEKHVVMEWEVCEDYIDRERELLNDPTRLPAWNLRSERLRPRDTPNNSNLVETL